MNYRKITAEILSLIEQAVGASQVFTDQAHLNKYAHDETEDLRYYPEVVVLPTDTAAVSALLKLCNEVHVPVTPRGGGTGLSGAALPIYGGVLLSMEKFKSILSIDTENLQATVEPGVITEDFMNAVAEKGLLYPVDPSSKGSCFIGGNTINKLTIYKVLNKRSSILITNNLPVFFPALISPSKITDVNFEL